VLYGTRVPGPAHPGAARSFCEVPRDPPPHPARRSGVPPAEATGASCREKTEHYLRAVRRVGLPGRTAAGVAFDGRAFVWHEWAEVQVDGAWIPVDPTFGELPASGPRFTVARWADDDRAARVAAGRRILACWGRASVLER
jgi:transglutaminase-like putative cysteine protease